MPEKNRMTGLRTLFKRMLLKKSEFSIAKADLAQRTSVKSFTTKHVKLKNRVSFTRRANISKKSLK